MGKLQLEDPRMTAIKAPYSLLLGYSAGLQGGLDCDAGLFKAWGGERVNYAYHFILYRFFGRGISAPALWHAVGRMQCCTRGESTLVSRHSAQL